MEGHGSARLTHGGGVPGAGKAKEQGHQEGERHRGQLGARSHGDGIEGGCALSDVETTLLTGQLTVLEREEAGKALPPRPARQATCMFLTLPRQEGSSCLKTLKKHHVTKAHPVISGDNKCTNSPRKGTNTVWMKL